MDFTYKTLRALMSSGLETSWFEKNSGVSVFNV